MSASSAQHHRSRPGEVDRTVDHRFGCPPGSVSAVNSTPWRAGLMSLVGAPIDTACRVRRSFTAVCQPTTPDTVRWVTVLQRGVRSSALHQHQRPPALLG